MPLLFVDGYNIIGKWARLKKRKERGDLAGALLLLLPPASAPPPPPPPSAPPFAPFPPSPSPLHPLSLTSNL